MFLALLHAKDTGNSKHWEPPAQRHEVITQRPEPSAYKASQLIHKFSQYLNRNTYRRTQ